MSVIINTQPGNLPRVCLPAGGQRWGRRGAAGQGTLQAVSVSGRGHFMLCLCPPLQILSLFCLGETAPVCHSPRDIPEHSTSHCGVPQWWGGTAEPAWGTPPSSSVAQESPLAQGSSCGAQPTQPSPTTVSATSHGPQGNAGEGTRASPHAGGGVGRNWGARSSLPPTPGSAPATWQCPTPSFPTTRLSDVSHHYRNKPSCTAANTTFRSPRWEMFQILFCTAEQVRDECLGGWAGQMEQEAPDKAPCWWQSVNAQPRADPSRVWRAHIPLWPRASCACCPHSTTSVWPNRAEHPAAGHRARGNCNSHLLPVCFCVSSCCESSCSAPDSGHRPGFYTKIHVFIFCKELEERDLALLSRVSAAGQGTWTEPDTPGSTAQGPRAQGCPVPENRASAG